MPRPAFLCLDHLTEPQSFLGAPPFLCLDHLTGPQSFLSAPPFLREKPIPGVLFSPKPFRSVDHPKGIPEVLKGLKPSKRKKLRDDTTMADLAAEECLVSHRSGTYFSLEHPFNSIARHLPSWRVLQREKGVHTTQYHSCMFNGSNPTAFVPAQDYDI